MGKHFRLCGVKETKVLEVIDPVKFENQKELEKELLRRESSYIKKLEPKLNKELRINQSQSQ